MAILKPLKINIKKKDDDAREVEEALLSPSSRMFHEPNYNLHILGILGWSAPEGPNWDLIRENLANTLCAEPRFSSLQIMDKNDGGKVEWIPTEVNLDNHIIIPDLDLNKFSSSHELVDDYITTLTRTTMDMSKPLWDVHFLQINSTEFFTVFRIHHSLGDGVSLVSLLLSCTRKVSDPNCSPDMPIPNIKMVVPQRENERHFWNYLIKMWSILQLFVNTMIDTILFFATALMLVRDSETPIRNSEVDKDAAHRRFVRCSMSLDDVKLVKNATNSTVNDVVLGVIQAGVSLYLTGRYALAGEAEGDKKDQAEKINNILKGIKCRAIILINLRPLLATNNMDELTENHTRLGNCFGFTLIPLRIAKKNNNPLDHVRFAKCTMNRKKNSLEVIWTSYIFGVVLKIFGYKAATSLAERVSEQTTLAFSNVMGPSEEISFCGYPMTFFAATIYGQPSPLMINVISYMNKLTIGISVDERIISDPYKLADDFVASLEDMKRVVLGNNS